MWLKMNHVMADNAVVRAGVEENRTHRLLLVRIARKRPCRSTRSIPTPKP
jgi:hypothetical protein